MKSVDLMVRMLEEFQRDNRQITEFISKFNAWKKGEKEQGKLF